MLQELLTLNLFVFVLIFVRVGTALMLMPGFGAAEINPTVKLVIALGISFILVPVLQGSMPRIPTAPASLGILFAVEALIGAFFGLVARILASALHVAGTIISFVSSMTNAFIQDPIAEQQSSTLSGFLSTVGLTLIFVTDMHHLLLRTVVESYQRFTPGQDILVGDFADMIARYTSDAFRLGTQLSAPFILVGLAYYVLLGILSRLMPALPVFFIGLPLQITAQLILLTIGLGSMMLLFLTQFEDALVAFLG
jgi:flagellar biosynthesis protein FliR